VRFVFSEIMAQCWLMFKLVSTLTAQVFFSRFSTQPVSSQPVHVYTAICLWVETFILLILNTMRLQLVRFRILLWCFWVEILPFGMSVNFLPSVASSINLLRLYSVASSRMLIKILNSIGSSIDSRVLCCLCQMNIQLSITAL